MAPLLSLDGVSMSYRRGRHEIVVLAEVSLEVRAGDLTAIWGKRRAGKTTLASVAAGLKEPSRGTVSFAGRVLAAQRDRAAHFQEVAWVQGAAPRSDRFLTLNDYVALPLVLRNHSPHDARRSAAELLELLELLDCAGERWEDLPDEQRTLAALAQALVRRPRLLIADDLTVDLDPLRREEVMALLRRTADEQRAGILVTVADMPDMLHANRIAVLSDGRLVKPGEPSSDAGVLIDFPAKRKSA
jgi:putative ABC transport system ATP-binding protein